MRFDYLITVCCACDWAARDLVGVVLFLGSAMERSDVVVTVDQSVLIINIFEDG
jgi:hypothetical protein